MTNNKPILLTEVLASAKNINAFKAAYGAAASNDEILNIFKRFNSQKARLPNKDIFKYDSLENLMAAINQKSGNEVEKAVRSEEANIIINNDKMTVVEPLTVAASKKYGANTKWCTISDNDEENGFDYWFKDYSLVYLIDKVNKKKYAIAFSHDYDEEGWDEEDEYMNVDEILDVFGLDFNDVFDYVISPAKKEELIGPKEDEGGN